MYRIINSVNSIVVNHVGLIGGRYIPLVVLIFLTIFMINILGLMPYTYTPSSHLLSLFVTTIISIAHYGLQFFTKGRPLMLIPLLVLI